MTHALDFLFTAPAIVLLTLIAAVWLRRRSAARSAQRLLLAIALWYGVFSIYGVSYQLERALVAGYHPITRADVPAGRTAVVVLGSGSWTTRDWDRDEYTIVDVGASERVLEAARIYRMLSADWVISSGGNVRPDDPDRPTAVAMQKALAELGVPASRIVLEARSRNTFEEATVLGPMLKELGAEQIVLVTSARHMRRSVGTFRAAGVKVIPAIARNGYLDRRWTDWWLPSEEGLWEAGAVVHELAGIAGYLATGRYRF